MLRAESGGSPTPFKELPCVGERRKGFYAKDVADSHKLTRGASVIPPTQLQKIVRSECRLFWYIVTLCFTNMWSIRDGK